MKFNTFEAIFITLAALCSQGCMTDNISVDDPEKVLVSFAADGIVDAEPLTKTALNNGTFLWSARDTVGIYPNTGSQLVFPLASGADCSTASFDGGGWDFKESATYYSYYPFIGDIYLDRTRIPVSFAGQVQNGVTNMDHFGAYDFMYADAATRNYGSIRFNYHHLVCILRIVATLPAGTYTQLTIKAPQPVFVKDGYYDLTSAAPSIVPVVSTDIMTLNLKNIHLTQSSNSCEMYIISAPFDLTDQDVVFTLTDNTGDEIQSVFHIAKAFVTGKRYAFQCSNWSRLPSYGDSSIQDWTDGVTVTIQ